MSRDDFDHGSVGHDLEPVSKRCRLGGIRVHPLQLLELAIDLLFGRLRHLAFWRVFSRYCGNLLAQFVAFTELALNRLHLLAQVELAL